jgi:hypothetical protein
LTVSRDSARCPATGGLLIVAIRCLCSDARHQLNLGASSPRGKIPFLAGEPSLCLGRRCGQPIRIPFLGGFKCLLSLLAEADS